MSNNYNIIGKLENVTRSFGDVVAVSDINFTIERGKIIGFLGPNGSGKTTSIQMLLGLLKANSGKVSLFGVNPFDNMVSKKLVGYISEDALFPKWATASQYLTNLAQFNMSEEEARNRSKEVLEEVKLSHVANKKIREFSKGMKQRIKIAQALIHKPALIIADEPFNGLDPVVRTDMFNLFRRYNKEYRTTFFISSHILFEVEKLADKIILVYKGRAIAQGTPTRIREKIQDQPHTIRIQTEDYKTLSEKFIREFDTEVMKSIDFLSENGSTVISLKTLNPSEFYQKLTKIVVRDDIDIEDIRPENEGLENLFKTLTVG